MNSFHQKQIKHFFKQNIPDEKIKQKSSSETKQQEQSEKWLICSSCSHLITRLENSISVHSKHMHRFVNPEGFYFEIKCFNRAPGCNTLGDKTGDFTWFPGYDWQLAMCANCNIHLGWKFISEESSFFGLITDRLIDIDAT